MPTTLTNRAAELRRAFDRSFGEPAAAPDTATLDLVAIRVGAASYAVRLNEIAGIHVDIPTTPVPSAVSTFRGLAAFRSVLTPVFDLAAILGGARASAPRWMVVEAKARIALAFDAFERHLAAEATAIAPPEHDQPTQHVNAILRAPGYSVPIIDLSSIVTSIRKRIPSSLQKEQ